MSIDLIWEDDAEYYRMLDITHTQPDVDLLPQKVSRPTSFEITFEVLTGTAQCIVHEDFPGLTELRDQFGLFQEDPYRNEAPYILAKRENTGFDGLPLYSPSRDPYLYPLVS